MPTSPVIDENRRVRRDRAPARTRPAPPHASSGSEHQVFMSMPPPRQRPREPLEGGRMSDQNVQIIARGPRAEAEAAAAAIDADPVLEAATYSILEEDEARGLWRLDIYPTSDAEAAAFTLLLSARPALH